MIHDNNIKKKKNRFCQNLFTFVFLITTLMMFCSCGENIPETSIQSLAGQYFLRGSFEYETQLPEEPIIKASFLLPCDKTGNLLPEAADIIFYAPAAYTRSAMDRIEIQKCGTSGCAIYSFDITSDKEYTYDPVHAYHLLSSGWDKVVFGVLQKIRKFYKLPDRKLLILGESTGSSMAAEYMSSAYGDKIDAVALLGTSYRWKKVPSQQIATLFINTWGCYGEKPTEEMAQAYRQNNPYVLSIRTNPPWASLRRSTLYHVPDQEAYFLAARFLTDFAALRRKNLNQFPLPSQWPVQKTLLGQTCFLPSRDIAEQILNLHGFN